MRKIKYLENFTIYHNALWGFMLALVLIIYYRGVVPKSDIWIAGIFFPILFLPGLIKVIYDWRVEKC